ncbi:MAG: UPF0489 family protein [Calditrichae bacterium]|nr:UPF0489 family protein [Calditrichia bacterium]
MFDIYKFYSGFYISEETGNNAFSFQQRSLKEIFVAPVIPGDLNDLSVGDKIAFCEIENGIEKSFPGLQNFIHLKRPNQEIIIFDNHNHAFFFWAYALSCGLIMKNSLLVHVDQHSDLWEPPSYMDPAEMSNDGAVFNYTNSVLSVGTFIKPALKCGIFNAAEIIDGNEGLKKSYADEIVLDIDMDFFAAEMDFVPHDLKIEKTREYIQKARFITIATSPFFIDQQKAIKLIPQLLS